MKEDLNKRINNICIIGCGNMGGACLAGWMSSEEGVASGLSKDSFIIVEPNETHRLSIASEYGVTCVERFQDIPEERFPGLVLLSVKPQVLPDVLEQLASDDILQRKAGSSDDSTILLSIAAGISTESIENSLFDGAHVVRAMPNMPLQVRRGATAVCAGSDATDQDVDVVNQLFSALGSSHVVDESEIDAICAISGGGPAYVAYMIEALRDAGVELGLSPDLAESLALETVGGTYVLMKEKSLSPEQMRKSVCSPGGTTLAALAELDSAEFKPMFEKAMIAAVERAAQLREGK